MRDFQKLEVEYRAELKRWFADLKGKSQKKWTQKEIARLGKYFNIDPKSPDSKELDNTTLSRVLREIPLNESRSYKLFTLLGILSAFDVIDEGDFRNFIHRFSITVPNSDTLERIWFAISDGAENLRQDLQSVAVSSVPSRTFDAKKIRLLALIGISGLAIFIVIILLRVAAVPGSTCTSPIEALPATLIPDQGFSFYQSFSNNPQSSILQNYIRSIGINSQGLWVGYRPTDTEVNAVSYYMKDEEKWVHCYGLQLEPGQSVNDFAFYNDSVFIATDGDGILELADDKWITYTKAHGLPSDSIYDLFNDDDDTLWAATGEGVAQLVDQHWVTIYQGTPGGLNGNHVHNFLKDQQGNLWFGLIDRGISRLDTQGQWHSYFTRDSEARNIRSIALDNAGGVWFATDGGGVVRFFEDEWQTFTLQNGRLITNNVQDVKKDKFDRVWITTDMGVFYTADYGINWKTHSSADAWKILFGCLDCPYDEDHLWLVLREGGLGHVRLPPSKPTINLIEVPPVAIKRSSEEYFFEVEVQVLLEDLDESDGLFSVDPNGTDLFGAWPIIPVKGQVAQGERYIFSNIDNPMIVPPTPGTYETLWRIWQNGRFVSEPITISFVVPDL